MSYPTLPGRAMPYHVDGTVVKFGTTDGVLVTTLSSDNMNELNDQDLVAITPSGWSGQTKNCYLIFFFPEERDVNAVFGLVRTNNTWLGVGAIQGSANSTTGYDGTWETATGTPNGATANADSWREGNDGIEGWQPVSFTTAITVLRLQFNFATINTIVAATVAHVFGVKGAGETADDILFLDAEDGDAEFTKDLDFGDRPAGTTFTRQIKVQNSSGSKTANTVTLRCSHTDFLISDDNVNWGSQVQFASLAAGVKSGVVYVKNTTPTPPTTYGPNLVFLTCEVLAWT